MLYEVITDEIDMLNKGYAKRNPDGSATKVSRKQVSWFDGAPLRLGSVEKLYCVFAMQTG